MESRKIVLMNLFAGKEWRHRCREWTCRYNGGRRQNEFRKQGWEWGVRLKRKRIYTHTHTHTYIYIYICIYNHDGILFETNTTL